MAGERHGSVARLELESRCLFEDPDTTVHGPPGQRSSRAARTGAACPRRGDDQFTGTNTGPVMMAGKEIPPTGRGVVGKGTYFVRVKNGKVVEFNSYPDIAGMMMQLGFMPRM